MDKGKRAKVKLNEEKPGQEASTGIQVTPGVTVGGITLRRTAVASQKAPGLLQQVESMNYGMKRR